MDTIVINPNETKVPFYYMGLSRKLLFKVGDTSGTNRVKAWWIKGPLGSVEGISDLVGSGNIPSKGLIWGKLKVSGADIETMIYVTADAKVSTNFPPVLF